MTRKQRKPAPKIKRRKPYEPPAIEKSEDIRQLDESPPPASPGGFGTRLRPGYSHLIPISAEGPRGPAGAIFQMPPHPWSSKLRALLDDFETELRRVYEALAHIANGNVSPAIVFAQHVLDGKTVIEAMAEERERPGLFYCISDQCPGLPYRASERAHLSCGDHTRDRPEERWYAYECLECGKESVKSDGTGVVFDVRANSEPNSARCPICGEICELRSQWLADPDGYGSRSTVTPPTEPDEFHAWIDAHTDDLAAHAGQTVAIHPTHGIVASSPLFEEAYASAQAQGLIDQVLMFAVPSDPSKARIDADLALHADITAYLASSPPFDTKEIYNCASCPMFLRGDSTFAPGLCTHWGSPDPNRISITQEMVPEWCPIQKKPLLLKVVR